MNRVLHSLPGECADYIAWQREQLSGERLKVLLDYWCSRLRDAPTELTLPTDRPRPAARSFAGAHELFDVGAELVNALRTLGREEGATLHMTLLSAFQLLLSRYSDQDDILVGVPVAGRGRAEFKDMVGYFSNIVVVAVTFAAIPASGSCCDALDRAPVMRMRTRTCRSTASSKLSPDGIAAAIPCSRSSYPAGCLPCAGRAVAARRRRVESRRRRHWNRQGRSSQRVLHGQSPGFAGDEYSTDLFDAATVRRMTGNFLTLLASIVADPDRPTSRLALLDAAERRRIVEWNATVQLPSHLPVPALFAATVQRVPAAIAVVDGARTLSYAELDRRSRNWRTASSISVCGRVPRVGVWSIARSRRSLRCSVSAKPAACACRSDQLIPSSGWRLYCATPTQRQ